MGKLDRREGGEVRLECDEVGRTERWESGWVRKRVEWWGGKVGGSWFYSKMGDAG